MKENYKIIKRKTNEVTYSCDLIERVYTELSYLLKCKYIYKANWITLVKRINLYNGYEKITFYSNSGYKYEFIVICY